MAEAREVEIPYCPREQFDAFHDRTQRFSIGVAHRRAGKTVAHVNELIRACMNAGDVEKRIDRGRFAYVAPYFRQAKAIAWDYVRYYSAPIPGMDFNETELRAIHPTGAELRLYGADNYDAMRGIYLDGVVLDEFGDMDPRAWSSVIRPALVDRKGWAAFIGTPRGRNEFYALYQKATNPAEWFRFQLKASETGIISADELRLAAASMSEEEYAAEFECSFDAPVIGSYYGKLIGAIESEAHIGSVPWEPSCHVHTAWDLGHHDSTAIWFAQNVGREIRIIDYYEASGTGLDHYAKILAGKPYVYGDHILPHDAAVHELGTGKARTETLRGFGIGNGMPNNYLRVLPASSPEDGINAVRLLLPKCWFDATKCERGIEALRMYRREFDDKTKAFRSRPLHDWTSHAADAFRYLAQGLREDQRPSTDDEAGYQAGGWMAA